MQDKMSEFMSDSESLSQCVISDVDADYLAAPITKREARLIALRWPPNDLRTFVQGDSLNIDGSLHHGILAEQLKSSLFRATTPRHCQTFASCHEAHP